MGLSRKLHPRKCFILTTLLMLSLFVLTVAGGDASNIAFFDNFEGTAVDPEKWVVQENTSMSGNPAYGGSVEVAESQIFLSSTGSSFPWVQTVANPFPTTGDFAVEFDLTYTCIGDWGNGLVISNAQSNAIVAHESIFTLWAHDRGESESEMFIMLLGKRVNTVIVQGWKPSEDKHFYRLEYSQGVYTVYVDDVAIASAPSQQRPDNIGLGHPPSSGIPNSYEQVSQWGHWGWTSSKIDALKVLSAAEVPEKDTANLSVFTNAETLQIGYMVDVSGTLTSQEGEPFQGETIILSYSISDTSNWEPIAAATTDSNGFYSISWLPTATGKFAIKAEWTGNEAYAETYTVKNISVTRHESASLLFAESNSTLSSLAFNSTSKEISFTVSGPSGTTGYVQLLISKTLMGNLSDFEVYMDGRQVEFTATSIGDFQSLHFEYTHSTHSVNIKLPASSVPEFPAVLILSSFIGLTLFAGFLYKKKRNTNQRMCPSLSDNF